MQKKKDFRRTRRWVYRTVAAVGAGTLLLCLPVDWGGVGTAVTLAAAAMGQPQNAAVLLTQRLSAAPVTNTVGGDTMLSDREPAPPSASGDHTAVQPEDLPAAAPVTVPKEDGSGGKVYERVLETGNTHSRPVAVLNRSNRSVDIADALATEFKGRFTDTDQPQVLIIHTHTTEGYMTYDAGYYNAEDRERTKDVSRNVCAVGQAVVDTLKAAGITALQDTTVHDSPQYTGAYNRSAERVQKLLKEHPSIKVVLDLHRDAVMQGDTGIVKPTATVDGKKAAQMMFIVGVTDTADLPHPYWKQNLALAAQWQKALTAIQPELMRPLNTVTSRYNQHLCPGYLLVEVGSEGNTVAEAVYSGQLLGKTLAKLLS